MAGKRITRQSEEALLSACRKAYCHIITQCPNVTWPENHSIWSEVHMAQHVLDELSSAYKNATGESLPDGTPFIHEEVIL